MRSKICLCLDGKTIQEDLALVTRYRDFIDLVELRVDCLNEDERLKIRSFPSLANIPCILTIRRKIDGGFYDEGEASRTTLFAMAIAYSGDNENQKPFDYIDMESDYNVASLQDAAMAYGAKIIRSYHKFDGPIRDLESELKKLKRFDFEIPKVAFMPNTLDDVLNLYRQSNQIEFEHIVMAMGPIGQSSRILATKFNSCITYTCPKRENSNFEAIGQVDPITLNEIYNFKDINKDTQVFGVAGYPLKVTASPALHNFGYKKHGINAVYIPIRSPNIEDIIHFAQGIGVKGLSVTVPFKKEVMKFLYDTDEIVDQVQATNTIVNSDSVWTGYNTDVLGFSKSLLEFLGAKDLRRYKVAIIGAGGAANAVAYAVKKLKGKACVFNRTVITAKELAEQYGFKYAPLSISAEKMLQKYSDLIIQTTSVGLGLEEGTPSNDKNDPIYFYKFSGKEKVYDVIYEPVKTPVLLRAEQAGCKICNGENMLRYQGYEQFKIYTGIDY